MRHNSIVIAAAFALGLLTSADAYGAACSGYPHTITNGSTADGGDVWDNFTSILNCINSGFAGNVGIGTASPSEKLTIQDSTFPRIALIKTGIGTWYLGGYGTSNSFNVSLNATAPMLTVGTNGFVGVGTTSPQRPLDIGTNGQVTFGDNGYSSTGSPGIFWYNDNVNYAIYKTAGSWSGPNYQQLELNFATGIVLDGGTAYGRSGTILQPNGGNVGIGTNSPAKTLTVFGDIRVGTSGTNGCLENAGGGLIVGTCSSDGALKTVAGRVTGVLDRLSNLELVHFYWNQTAAAVFRNSTTTLNTGFIAQSVQQQFPELVSIDGHGYRQLNYTTLGLYGLEAIKELKVATDANFVAIRTRSEKLASEIARLRTRVANQDAAILEMRTEIAALQRASKAQTASR